MRSNRNFSAGTSCCINPTASLTSSSASSIEAAISIRVEVRACRIVTTPAISPAITSISMKTMSSCARTERPYHSQCDNTRADGHAGGLSNDALPSVWALMNVLPVVPALHHTLWDGAASNGTLSAGNGRMDHAAGATVRRGNKPTQDN